MKNQVKTVVLLSGLSALLVAFGTMLGPGWTYGALAAAVLFNAGAYFFSDRIILAMHEARELDRSDAPWLFDMVEELSARAEIPMPRICLVPDSQPNAFATGRSPTHGVVAVTDGILNILDRRQLRGVIARELGHIKNRDILISSIAAVLSAAVTYLAHALSFFPLFGGEDEDGASPVGTLLIILTAPLLALVIQMGISRSRELLADRTGAQISGDPDALADALETLERAARRLPGRAEPATASLFIVNPLAGADGVMRLFSTHPTTAERVARLRVMSYDMPHRRRQQRYAW